MRKKILAAAIIAVIFASMFSFATTSKGKPNPIPEQDFQGVYTPNIDLLIASAIKRGLLPAAPTDEEVTNYLQAYFAQKMIKPYEYVNPRMAERFLARDSGEEIGVDPNIDPVGTAKMLVLIVEFSGTGGPGGDDPGSPFDGPLHNEIPKPPPPDNTQFWIPDFNTAHYQSMMFDHTPGAHSMANYYFEQSYGVFTVDGNVFGWVKIKHTEWWYGADHPAGGTDNLNGPKHRIVKDAIDAANLQYPGLIPWGDFDTDLDGYVDHFAVIHSGEDQAAGGGAQGDDAIWSMSGGTPDYFTGGYNANGDPVYTYAYTIMPENGNIGVFSHEFAHDIGLPDSYDTIYSGESNPAFWDNMASGSWLGDDKTIDTHPSHISIWGKMALGWVSPALGNMERYSLSQLVDGEAVEMKQVETPGGIKAVRVDLPMYDLYMNTPYSGKYEWWSDKADLLDNRLTRTVDLTPYSGKTVTLSFWTEYAIEEFWDFGFVQVSTDGGITWMSLPDLEGRTTYTHDPDAKADIVANLPGLTGFSNGWVHETFDLSPYAGSSIRLRFRYMTDWAVNFDGWFLDEITITADGSTIFYDGAETLDPGWTAKGWTRTLGTRKVGHYYIMEWRNFVGFDESLKYAYNWINYAAGYAERFSYNPGLLLWYRNFGYTNNWVGVHPGYGFLLVVDSHPAPIKTDIGGFTFRTRIQAMDATFSRQRTISNTLTYLGVTKTYPSLNGKPIFDDRHQYYNPSVKPIWTQSANYPYNLFRYPIPADWGTIVPTYRLRIQVTSQDTGNTWGIISFGLIPLMRPQELP